jgi:ADP-ribose pyrophosphatase
VALTPNQAGRGIPSLALSRIVSRTETVLSPWVRLVANTVETTPGAPGQIYHSFAQADYMAVLARTPSGHIPIVRQFRAAVGCETWELPAGLVESGESAESCCRRELREETGVVAEEVHALGAFFTDTGRLENRIHVFAVEASEPDRAFVQEPGLSVAFVSPAELRDRILEGTFTHQLHLGVLAIASLKGFGVGLSR